MVLRLTVSRHHRIVDDAIVAAIFGLLNWWRFMLLLLRFFVQLN